MNRILVFSGSLFSRHFVANINSKPKKIKTRVGILISMIIILALALYKHHLGVAGWGGVEDSLDELGRIRKTTLDFGGERCDKISVLTKEQKDIIEKLGVADALF